MVTLNQHFWALNTTKYNKDDDGDDNDMGTC